MILKTMLDKHLEEVKKFCDRIRGYGPHSQMDSVIHLEFLLKIIDELVAELKKVRHE